MLRAGSKRRHAAVVPELEIAIHRGTNHEHLCVLLLYVNILNHGVPFAVWKRLPATKYGIVSASACNRDKSSTRSRHMAGGSVRVRDRQYSRVPGFVVLSCRLCG